MSDNKYHNNGKLSEIVVVTWLFETTGLFQNNRTEKNFKWI